MLAARPDQPPTEAIQPDDPASALRAHRQPRFGLALSPLVPGVTIQLDLFPLVLIEAEWVPWSLPRAGGLDRLAVLITTGWTIGTEGLDHVLQAPPKGGLVRFLQISRLFGPVLLGESRYETLEVIEVGLAVLPFS